MYAPLPRQALFAIILPKRANKITYTAIDTNISFYSQRKEKKLEDI
jgi:hypothetical protein